MVRGQMSTKLVRTSILHVRLGKRLRACHALYYKSTVRFVSSSSQIRSSFLDYFAELGHTRVQSSSLVPDNDNTLLFTNSGMVQFKEKFLGAGGKYSGLKSACSSQKCLRVGGKHNDLENVGLTPRHHTFFEMLGNFSFGDYFKEEAILYAWNFLVKELGISKSRLQVTVHKQDKVSQRIWKQIAPNTTQILLDSKENFWTMGEGANIPCGPCTEIFYDIGNPHGGTNLLEIWNIVFMEYEMNSTKQLHPLPEPCVDTGMGLERITSVIQGVQTNFETDLFAPILSELDSILEATSSGLILPSPTQSFAKYVIADHIRAIAVLICDGVFPSNTGRGHVLRRIIRRAIGFGRRLGLEYPFLVSLLPQVEATIGDEYTQLLERRETIVAVIEQEENIFVKAYEKGFSNLENHLKANSFTAEEAFKLYDSYGFPWELSCSIASDHGIQVNTESVRKLMDLQRKRSGQGISWEHSTAMSLDVQDFENFVGYEALSVIDSKVKAVSKAENGNSWIVIDPCPFYGESGGQVSDSGWLYHKSRKEELQVLEAIKLREKQIAVLVEGEIHEGESVDAHVDRIIRKNIAVHHTATHALNAALKTVLQQEVIQAGSLVNDKRLRFDFTFPRALTNEEIYSIESLVNWCSQSEYVVLEDQITYAKAKEMNACMVFNEKYGEVVRVVSFGEDERLRSVELCGGTHVKNTRYLFPFKIVSESSAAAGTRRIQAVSGYPAFEWLEAQNQKLHQACQILKVASNELPDHVLKLKKKIKQLKQENRDVRIHLSANREETKIIEMNGFTIHILAPLEGNSNKEQIKSLREYANKTSNEAGQNNIQFFFQGKNVICSVKLDPAESHNELSAKSILNSLLKLIGGRGGGNQGYAQGKLHEAVQDENRLAKHIESLLVKTSVVSAKTNPT